MLFKCSVCGFIWDGDEAPEKCPKCGAPREKFNQLEEDIANLVLKSRETNDLHMNLAKHLAIVAELAQRGLEIKLDPGCVDIFEKALKASYELRQMVKAELATHMTKQKWG